VSVAEEASDTRVCTQHAKEDAKCEEVSKPVEPVKKCGGSKVDPSEEVVPPVKGKGEDKPPSSCTGVAHAPQSYNVVCAVKHKTYANAVRVLECRRHRPMCDRCHGRDTQQLIHRHGIWA
jgi:hypothetical protein